MSRNTAIFWCLLFGFTSLYSQTITGIVLDKQTNLPIESASIYFDGTTIGTSTNSVGEFKIERTEGVTSPLTISFLGYATQFVVHSEFNQFYKILLVEAVNSLDEVFISSDDGMPKAIKLQHFRNEFLGKTDNGKACHILNESDLILRFNSKTNQLTASSRRPVVVRNDNLQYLINFDIQEFVIDYRYVDLLLKQFSVHSITYSGSSFYKDIDTKNKKSTEKKRDKAYEGSTLHFMRALYTQKLKERDYKIFEGSFEVNPYQFISISPIDVSENVNVTVSKKLNILFDKKFQSTIEVMEGDFVVDPYGNYLPIDTVFFGGDMGEQRLGDSLPFDYKLLDK